MMKNPIIQDEKAVAQRRRIINTTFGDLVVAVTDEVKPYIGDPSCRYAVVSQILSDLLTRRVAHVQHPSLAGIDLLAMEAEVEDSAQRFD
jgi:hypothetical protein